MEGLLRPLQGDMNSVWRGQLRDGHMGCCGSAPHGGGKEGMGDSLTQKSSSYLETTGCLLTIKTQLFFLFFFSFMWFA